MVVEPLRRVDLEDSPAVQDRDPLPERHGLDLVVRDVDGGHAESRVQLRERGAHAHAELGVQVRERLVHEEGLRLAHDCAAHRHPLALAAGELRRPPLEEVLEAEQLRHVLYAPPCFLLRRSPDLEPVADVLADIHVRVERVALEHHRDVAAAWRQVGDVSATDRDAALADLLEPRDHPEQRRLAATRGADEDEELAVLDAQVDVLDGDHSAGEDLRQVFELDLGHAAPRSRIGPLDRKSKTTWWLSGELVLTTCRSRA